MLGIVAVLPSRDACFVTFPVADSASVGIVATPRVSLASQTEILETRQAFRLKTWEQEKDRVLLRGAYLCMSNILIHGAVAALCPLRIIDVPKQTKPLIEERCI